MSLLVVLVCDCSFAVFYSCYLSDFVVAVLEGLDTIGGVRHAEGEPEKNRFLNATVLCSCQGTKNCYIIYSSEYI